MTAKRDADAGLLTQDHYARRLPPWRYRLRQRLLPLVRGETPYLARLQRDARSPALDSYFATTANLGSLTFFMVFLPLLFWTGHTELGRALTHMLAIGVFFSGCLKDLVCLPRPLSPPLHRITMSPSVSLEYGFPSTHATNAISVAVYFIYGFHSGKFQIMEPFRSPALFACYWYALSITSGRIYCGMHGFVDVVAGSVLGVAIGLAQIHCGPAFDSLYTSSPFYAVVALCITVLIAVRNHPEPADDCPCFDDSVAFLGVVMGINIGQWHFARHPLSWDHPVPATVPFELARIGIIASGLRLVSGVLVILMWRATMKKALLTILPPIFRRIEIIGLNLPRRFFTDASKYKIIPHMKSDDNIIPSARDIPGIISGRGRKRTVSIGPQSEADAREHIAQREIRRSMSRTRPGKSPHSKHARTTSGGTDETPSDHAVHGTDDDEDDDVGSRELFSMVARPRVHYDVEVVTKLIIYAGIGWLAVMGNPIMFWHIGLGIR